MTGTNLTIHRGASFYVSFTAKDSLGVAVDITGYTVAAVAMESATSETIAFDLAPTIPTGTDGVFLIEMNPAQTLALTTGIYIWDIVLTDESGYGIPVAGGTIKVRPLATTPT